MPLNAYDQILFNIIMQPQKTFEMPLRGIMRNNYENSDRIMENISKYKTVYN